MGLLVLLTSTQDIIADGLSVERPTSGERVAVSAYQALSHRAGKLPAGAFALGIYGA